MYKIDNWINEGSGWVIESVDAEYLNISISIIELPRRLGNSMKDLPNIKNNNNKCFLCCHIRHLNPLKIHSEGITKADENLINDHDHEGVECLVSGKYFHKIEKKMSVLMYFNILFMCRMKNVKAV